MGVEGGEREKERVVGRFGEEWMREEGKKEEILYSNKWKADDDEGF